MKKFSEPAHIGRIVVGGTKGDGKTRVSREEINHVISVATLGTADAATVYKGRGKWRSPKGELFNEPSTIIEVASSATDSCDRFHKRMRAIAARASKIADQQSVLAVTHCAGGRVEADIVDRTMTRQMELKPVRKLAGVHRTTRKRKRCKR